MPYERMSARFTNGPPCLSIGRALRLRSRHCSSPGVLPGFRRDMNALNFGRFRFEPESARLWAGKREIKLTLKASAVLALLTAGAGEPVAKDELFAEVWRGTVVSDDALVTCIQELRKALGDDARKPKFIETRHRRGYRFAAEVSGAPHPAGPA